MKVLHVQNCADVPYTIADELVKRGHESKVLASVPAMAFTYNPLWLHLVPNQKLVDIHFGKSGFPGKIFAACKDYDVIHIHIWDRIIWWLKVHWNKPFVLTYHGYDIRGKWKYHRFWEVADYVTVSTKDLLKDAPPHVEYIPNPVDRTFWKRRFDPIPNTALWPKWIEGQMRATDTAEKVAEDAGLHLVTQFRNEMCFPYLMMPYYMSHFSHFLDIKIDHGTGRTFDVFTLTGLQALSMGMKTYHPKFGWCSSFPSDHNVRDVVDRWEQIYEEVLEKKKVDW